LSYGQLSQVLPDYEAVLSEVSAIEMQRQSTICHWAIAK
jgi:hypothetical protein